MIERLALPLVPVLLLLVGCEPEKPKLTEEEQLREKFSKQECWISRRDLPPILRNWHARLDCPDFASDVADFKKTGKAPLKVKTKPEGVFDEKDFKYELDHCAKCVY